jgi:predicted nucleic acid-binding Zn ribbon protein
MPTYRYICKQRIHGEPLITELRQSIKTEVPEYVQCKGCGAIARRHWVGMNFYAIVPGAHGGGPATK